MHDEHLPVGPDSGGERLPVRVANVRRNALTPARQSALSPELQNDHPTARDEIDLLSYWHTLVKRRWLVLGIVGTVIALSLLLTLMTTPMYRATAMLKLEDNEQQIIQMGNVAAPAGARDPAFLTTQYELLRSRALAERVADDLDLTPEAISRLRPKSWWQRLKSVVRPAPRATAAEAAATSATDAKAAEGERRDATQVISAGLTVEPIRNSQLVMVHFDSPLPTFAARAANALADGFIAAELDRRFGASSYAKTYLEQQLALVKSRLENSERQLVSFAQKENLVNTGEGHSLVGQNLSDLNASLAEAQSQRIRAQARWQQAQGTRGGALPHDMLGNSIMPTLQQQRAQLQRTYQEKLQIFKPDYPEMQQLQGQLDELGKQINTELANIRASIRAEYAAAVTQENLLKGQLEALRAQTLDVDNRSIQYNILKREVDTNRQLYDGLLQRYKEVGVAGDVRQNTISIVDRAQVPDRRFKPSVLKNAGIGLLLGLLLGVIAAFVREFLDDTIKTPEDVEQRLRLAVLGIIPKLSGKQTPAQAALEPRSAFSESYRSVRTALQFATDHGVPKVMLVTSAGAGDGKTTSALALARNFAQLGKRVLLIEADLRNPSLHKVLRVRAGNGLSNLLSGAATLLETISATDDARLDVLLAGPLPPNPVELLSGARLVSLLSLAGEYYDQIIIDGPPVMGIADAPVLANAADATLLVVHSGVTKIGNAQVAIKRLLAARAHLIGVLLTMYDAKTAGYKYESYYAYGGTPQLTRR